jgi:hypothetical protein
MHFYSNASISIALHFFILAIFLNYFIEIHYSLFIGHQHIDALGSFSGMLLAQQRLGC